MAKKYYAVRKGWSPGVYLSLKLARKQTRGYPNGGVFRGFNNLNMAIKYSKDELPDTRKRKKKVKEPDKIFEDSGIGTKIHAYVDGSYNYQEGIGGCGLVFVKNDIIIYKHFETVNHKPHLELHNISVELRSAVRAVETAIHNDYENITLFYDYVGISDFLSENSKIRTETVQNYRNKMLDYQNKININFHRLKGHSGNQFHNLADRLAKHGAGVREYSFL